MNNKTKALILTVFIVVLFLIIAVMGIAGHIPFIGKGIALVIAIILILFIIGFVIVLSRRK